MPDLIYNIKNIFDTTDRNGCLSQYEAKKYLIPAYQRGYKWASKKENDAVCLLMRDLKVAFENAKLGGRKEYFLQYITIKKNESEHLEVIDGQQRLTTLSILLSVFNLLDTNNEDNIADGKLHYALRDNFFDTHIYKKEKLEALISKEWDNEKGIQLEENEYKNEQDLYYLFHAAKFIKEQLDDMNLEQKEFYKFIVENVKLIVNSVEYHIESERVFSNLNSNKVPLTDVELVKGLLLTKATRQNNNKHFREILEIRASKGRQWDEIESVLNDDKFSSFFFKKGKGMEGLLLLVAESFESKADDKTQYPIFNFFNQKQNYNEVFDKIKLYYFILKDWYENIEIYNLLGFIFFAEKEKDFLNGKIEKNHVELINILKEKRTELLPNSDSVAELNYSENRNEINKILLAMSVFNISKEIKEVKFDFYDFAENKKWTLEHIFPQNPEGKDKCLTVEQRESVIEILGGKEKIDVEIYDLLNKENRTDEEKTKYYDLLASKSKIHSIGNMALLTPEDNSSVGNSMFDEKRKQILERIQKGSFVPKHTFEVFSKMIFKENVVTLTAWSNDDIVNHTKIIEDFVTHFKKTEIL